MLVAAGPLTASHNDPKSDCNHDDGGFVKVLTEKLVSGAGSRCDSLDFCTAAAHEVTAAFSWDVPLGFCC